VCQEISRVIIQQEQQRFNISLNISYALSNVPTGYVQLLCEPNRMACADQLQNVTSVKTSLLLVSRTLLTEVRQLTHIFSGEMPASRFGGRQSWGYQQLNDEALAEIMYPITTYKLNVNLAMELYRSYPGQNLYQQGPEFASYQQANRVFSNCQPHLARQLFFNGSHLVTKFSNEVLFTSVATMLTACIESNARRQLTYIHSEEQSSVDATYDPRWLMGFCTLSLMAVILLGINLKVSIKPTSIIQYALNTFLFGKSKTQSTPAEQERLLKLHEDKFKTSATSNLYVRPA
jgi:hypothetical protein